MSKETKLDLEEAKPKATPKPKAKKTTKVETPPQAPTKKPDEMVTKSRVYLRKEPNFRGEVVKILPRGEKVHVLEIKNKWAKTKDGFILAEILEPAK